MSVSAIGLLAASSGRSNREVRVRVRLSPKDLQKALNDDSEFRNRRPLLGRQPALRIRR